MEIIKENYFDNDELKIYRGKDFEVSKYIIIHQPTLDEICDFGEKKYYQTIYNFVATPQSMKAQLWTEWGIDYMDLTPYQLFYNLIIKLMDNKNTSIIFGNLDFSKFVPLKKESNDVCLCQVIDGELVEFDEYTYNLVVDYICKTHFIERDLKIPANNSTKRFLIEDAIDEMNRNKNIEYHSNLKNLISAMINCEGFKYNHSQVWGMKINAFMDSVRRIGKIKNANLLLQSGYSGFGINLKEINKKQLDWLGELD